MMPKTAAGALKIAAGSETWLFLGIFGVVGILVLPMPVMVIDALLAVTICLALILVVFAVRVKSPTELSTFPSVLLFLTVFRIAIDVAVTRAVLVNGDAGHLVLAFGRFVAGGSVGIGLMVFLTITVVQFIVIAKGSERVAEVVARFTLDGLPGRQMSIDADLRNGAITEEQAMERRSELERETQFHGSMDGAVRFVKGDVIACLIIVFINLIGGIGVGVLSRGLEFGDAIDKYSILSIGGGLISQIGSVLTALAAALLTTRSSKDAKTDLGTNFVRQFSGYPSVLVVVGCGCFLVALVPGLPWGAFVACGIVLIAYGLRQHKVRLAMGFGGLDGQAEDSGAAVKPYHVFSARTMPDTAGSIRLVLPKNLAKARVLEGLGKRYASILSDTMESSGVRLPMLEIIISEQNKNDCYQISMHGVERSRGTIDAVLDKDGMTTQPLTAYSSGKTWSWKPSADSTTNAQLPGTFVDAAAMVGAHLEICIAANLHRIPTVGDIRKLLSSGGKDYATMLADLTRGVALVRVCGIVRRLIHEGVPVHNVRALMAGLLMADPAQKDDDTIVDMLRVTLRDSLCAKLSGGANELDVVEIGDHLAVELSDAMQRSGGANSSMLPPERVTGLREQFAHLAETFPAHSGKFVLIASNELRSAATAVLRLVHPTAIVLAWGELSDDLEVRSLGTLE
jgi:type III secretion protein V